MAKFTGLVGQRELLSYTDPHPGKKGSDFVAGDCSRCGGYGFIPAYGHVQMGRCFKCFGNGVQNVTVNTVRKHARAAAYARDFAAELAEFRAVSNWLQAETWFHAEQAEKAAAEAAEAERQAAMIQGFIGEVGEKVSGIEISVKVAKYIAGSYNRSSAMFIIAETDAGQVLKIFGSAASVMQLERGDRATILTGKVKAHDSYEGQDQSVLSHVKVEIQADDEVDLDGEERAA